MGKLDGKKALVTGASRGIGKGIARALAAEGADVAIGYRREKDAADAVVREIEGLGRRGAAFAADVREWGAVEAMVNGARETLGGLDVVVANAGVPTRFESTHEVDPGYWDRVLQIDLYGVFYTLRAALPHLREQREGAILVVSSIAADACGAKGAAYNAAKAGVNALAKTVSRENARRNVRCNVIAPGLIQTDIADGMQAFHGDLEKTIPLGRIGTIEDIGAMAVYLASKDAEWVTGKIFRIDGGAW